MEGPDDFIPHLQGRSALNLLNGREFVQSAHQAEAMSQPDPTTDDADREVQASASPAALPVEDAPGSTESAPRGWADAVRHGGESPSAGRDAAENLCNLQRQTSFERGENVLFPALGGARENFWAENTRRARSGNKRGGGSRRRGNVRVEVSLQENVVCAAPMVLHEMFIERLSADVIDMAYSQVGQDMEAAIEVLLELSQFNGQCQGASDVCEQADSSVRCTGTPSSSPIQEAAVTGDGSSSRVSVDSIPVTGEKVDEAQHGLEKDCHSEGGSDCGWDKLPSECRLMIFGHLSSREIARVSMVSKDFAAYATEFRSRVTFLAPPRMTHTSAVAEMVAAFPNLRSLSLKRWGRDLLGFRRIFVAAAGISLYSPKCKAQMRLVDDSWFVATSKRSLASIDLRNCQNLTDEDVGTLCRLHTRLQSIDLSHCNKISDFSLKHLSRFRSSGSMGERSPGNKGSGEAGEGSVGAKMAGYASPSRSSTALPESPSSIFRKHGVAHPEEAGGIVFRFESSPGGPADSGRDGEEEQRDGSEARSSNLSSNDDDDLRAADMGNGDPVSPASSSIFVVENIERGIGRVNIFSSSLREVDMSSSPLKEKNTEGGVDGLKSLSFKGCKGISTRGLQMLLTQGTCKDSLTSLDVSECIALTRTALQMSGKVALQRLRAMRLPHLTGVPMSLLSPNLKELYLDNNPHLREVCYNGRVLECLSVTNCPELSCLQVQAPVLSQLHIASCTALRNIREFQCPALRKVNAFMCRTLTRSAIETVIRDSTSTLSELNLSGCHGLNSLTLLHQQLTRLEVNGCDELVRLTVESKILTEFDARGCNKLEELTLESALLTRLLLNNCRQLRALSIPVWRIVDASKARRNTGPEPSPISDKVSSVTTVSPQGKSKKEGKGAGKYVIEVDVKGCNLPDDVEEMLRRLRVSD